MGLCCCAASQPDGDSFLTDQALIVSSRTREEIEEVARQPLLGQSKSLFKSAADMDTSSSPLEPELVDEMLKSSTSSTDGGSDGELPEAADFSEEND